MLRFQMTGVIHKFDGRPHYLGIRSSMTALWQAIYIELQPLRAKSRLTSMFRRMFGSYWIAAIQASQAIGSSRITGILSAQLSQYD
jgi:hypothetical protein